MRRGKDRRLSSQESARYASDGGGLDRPRLAKEDLVALLNVVSRCYTTNVDFAPQVFSLQSRFPTRLIHEPGEVARMCPVGPFKGESQRYSTFPIGRVLTLLHGYFSVLPRVF